MSTALSQRYSNRLINADRKTLAVNPTLSGAHPERLQYRIANRLGPAIRNYHHVIRENRNIILASLHHCPDVHVYFNALSGCRILAKNDTVSKRRVERSSL